MTGNRPICAVVPVKDTRHAKQRLAGILDDVQRQQLAHAMLDDVLAALTATAQLSSIIVVTSDRVAIEIAARHGIEISGERAADGHTAAVTATARRLQVRGFDLLTVPADIPLVRSEDIHELITAHTKAFARQPHGFSIVPARDQRGSNAVVCSPPGAVPLRFGNDSFFAHLASAKVRGIEPMILRLPRIALDVDAPDDLALLVGKPACTRAQELLAHWHLHADAISACVRDQRSP